MDEEQNISNIENKEKNADIQKVKNKAKQKAIKAGKKIAKEAGKSGSKVASIAPALPYILIAVAILLILIGSFVAIKTMPSAFTNTVSKYVEGTFQTVLDLFKSNEAKFSKDSVKRMHNTASYLRDHGTNLYADGYIFEKVKRKDNLKKSNNSDAENKTGDSKKEKKKTRTNNKKPSRKDIEAKYGKLQGMNKDEIEKIYQKDLVEWLEREAKRADNNEEVSKPDKPDEKILSKLQVANGTTPDNTNIAIKLNNAKNNYNKVLNKWKEQNKEEDKKNNSQEEVNEEDYKYDGSDLTDEDRFIPEEGIYVDKEGKVKYMKYAGSPLFYYVWMNGYTYMVDDQHGNFWADLKLEAKGFFKFIADFLVKGIMFDDGAESFPGMIYIDIQSTNIFRNLKNEFVPPKIEVDLDKKVLTIRNRGTANNVTLAYKLEGWAGRYGIPINYIYALHDSTMAPDLIIELIKGTKFENGKYRKTKMNLIGQEYKANRRLKFVSGNILANPGEYTEEDIRELTAQQEKEMGYRARANSNVPREIKNYKRVRAKVPETNNDKIYYMKKTLNYKKVTPQEVNATFKPRDVENIKEGEYYNSDDVRNYVGDDYGDAMELIDKKFGKSIISKIKGALTGSTDSKEYVYLLRMKDVVDHWFRDVYFEMPKGTKYLKYDTDYLIKTGELWTKMKGNVDKDSNKKREAEVQEAESNWSAYDNPETDEDESNPANLKGEEKVIKSEKVTKETFEKVLKESSEGDRKELEDALNLLQDNLYVELTSKAEPVKQYQDARRGMTNQRLLDIFKQKWYIYDGTEETANAINKDRKAEIKQYGKVSDSFESKYKKKIDPKVVLPEVADTLRRSGDLDSEYIYKDIKELLVELGYNRDKLRDPIRPVIQWVFKKMVAGKSFPSGFASKDETEHGIRFLSEEAVKSLYYTEALSQEQAGLDNKKIQIENKKRAAYKEKDDDARDKLYGELATLEEEYEKAKVDFISNKQKLIEKYGTKSQIENELKDIDNKISNAKTDEEKKKLEEFKKAAQESQTKKEQEKNENKDSEEAKKKEQEDKKAAKNDPVIKKIQARYGKGYKEGDFILSPVTGKIKYMPEENCVEVTALTKDDLASVPEGYKEFYETEYKGTIEGYKIRIYNVEQVSTEEKGKYKRQIPKKLISKLSTKEEQEKVENSEKLKKEAPEKEGDYVKEGTVIAKPIMDTEKIKEGKKKQKEKEKEEEKEIEANQTEEEKKKFGGLNKLAKKKHYASNEAKNQLELGDIGDAPFVRMTMIDTDNSIVDRLPEYMQKNKGGGGFEIEIADDYDTRGYGGELELDDVKNCLDPEDPESVDILKEIIATKYTDPEVAFVKDPEAFLEAQKETGVNAFFAICVSIVESSGGTAWAAIDKSSNNIFSIKDVNNGWANYSSLKDAVTKFGELISKGSYYWQVGKYTVREIGPTYCERVANSSEQWEDKVVKYWTELLEKAQELGY